MPRRKRLNREGLVDRLVASHRANIQLAAIYRALGDGDAAKGAARMEAGEAARVARTALAHGISQISVASSETTG
jgi:hypothetical protein